MSNSTMSELNGPSHRWTKNKNSQTNDLDASSKVYT